MKDCKPLDTPISNADKFNLNQCPKNEFEWKEMQNIPYASAAQSLMYAHVCTQLDIAYTIRMLDRYLNAHGKEY